MKAQNIVDQLSKILPNYTDGFSNSANIQSAVIAGDVVTVTTDVDHGLVNGQNVAISGAQAPVQIDTASFLRTGTTAEFDTVQAHDFTLSQRDIANGGKTLTISGATEAEFNGTFQLVGVPNRNRLQIAVADAGPVLITGAPIVENANGKIFDGLYPVANVTANTFEYTIAGAYALNPVVTNAKVQVSIRIISVLDIVQYLQDVYTKKEVGEDVLVVQLGDVTPSKSRSEPTDAVTSNSGQYAFNQSLIQPFALYILQNVTDQLAAAEARDKVESEYIPAIFRAVNLAQFDSEFSYSSYRATFTGHGVFAYSDENGKNKALYAHEVTFEQLVQITGADSVEAPETVAMRDVEYSLTTDLGTGELEANVNLDETAEPEV